MSQHSSPTAGEVHSNVSLWYRRTRNLLKIRSTPTEGKQTTQMKEWTTETRNIESDIPAIPYGTRDCAIKNSQRYTSSNTVQLPLPSLDLPDSENLSENREESQIAEPLCTDGTTLDEPDAQNVQCTPHASGTRKSTHENFGKPTKSFSDFIVKTQSTWIGGLPVGKC